MQHAHSFAETSTKRHKSRQLNTDNHTATRTTFENKKQEGFLQTLPSARFAMKPDPFFHRKDVRACEH